MYILLLEAYILQNNSVDHTRMNKVKDEKLSHTDRSQLTLCMHCTLCVIHCNIFLFAYFVFIVKFHHIHHH